MPYCRRLPDWVLVAVLTASGTPQAAEWVAEPSVSVRGEYDDNFRLTTQPHDDVWSAVIDPRLRLSRRSELWDLNASGRVRAAKYFGDDNLDNNIDNYLDLAAKRTLERGSLNASASLINDTTLQNEVLDIDTGITVNQIDRTQRTLSLSGQYMFTETTWIEASVASTDVEYDQGEQFGLLNYSYVTPGLQVIHQLTPKTRLFAVLNHTRVEYDNISDLESKTDSLQIGGAYDITETWSVNGSIGSRRTQTSENVPSAIPRPGFELLYPYVYDTIYLPRDAESTGLVYNASLTRKFESGHLDLSASQQVTPSSTGTDTESTRISINANREVSAKLSTGLAVSYYQSSTVGDVTTRADNDSYRIAPNLTWRLDQDLTLRTGYTYTRVKRGAAGGDTADSNAVFVGLGYTWPRISVSR